MPRPPDDDQEQAVAALHRELAARLAANVRRLRAESNWSQEATAWSARISTRFYQQLEGAEEINATLNTLARLAIGFGVDAAELLRPAPPAKRLAGKGTRR